MIVGDKKLFEKLFGIVGLSDGEITWLTMRLGHVVFYEKLKVLLFHRGWKTTP